MRVKKLRPKDGRDKLVYGDGIVSGIVLLAVEEIPYVDIYRGITNKKPASDAVKVSIDKNTVSVEVTVTVNYSQCVSDMAFRIQEAVKYNVESMTDYTVLNVNVNVRGVTFEEITAATLVKENAEKEKSVNTEETGKATNIEEAARAQ